MSGILKGLGLTPEEVKRLTRRHVSDANRSRNTAVSFPTYNNEEPKYLLGPTQLRIRHRLTVHKQWMIGRFVMGEHPSVTAMHLCVSEESVRKRLREAGLFDSNGKAGRPRKDANQSH
jgi:hypothetical protein